MSRRSRLLLVAAIILAIGALAWWVMGGSRAAPDEGPIGGVTGCQAQPRFTAGLGLGPRAALGSSVTGIMGLAVIDPDKPADAGGVFQHATWDDAGYLGPFVYDRQGNIFVAPAPLASLEDNPPEEQNTIYRVDTDSMEMRPFIALPSTRPPSGANPFGVIGLAYDCETDSLYASSVAGSTAGEELGRIHRIDIPSARVAAQREGRDSFGLGVFRGQAGKRLYFGLARAPELHSIALDAAGDFVGEPRRELSLAELPDGTQDKIRRIRFGPGPEMILQAYDFNYSLQAASERIETVFRFRYDAAADAWLPGEAE